MRRGAGLRRRRGEQGFALLLIFLMASAIALMLYRQLPREAFESERDKEQMLIDRGEQYKRAIYLYYVQNNRQWPAKIEDLENTNNHRYLRHRYIDPYTGKDEWRLIHTNGTFLTDSLVKPPPAQPTPGSTPSNVPAPLGGTGTLASGPTTATPNSTGTTPAAVDPNAPPPEQNAQVQLRASDRTLTNALNSQNQQSGIPQGNDPGYQPFNPAALPPISLYPNGYNAAPANAPGTNGTNQPNQPGVNPNGVNPLGVNQPGINQPGMNQPGLPGFTLPGTNTQVTNPINPLFGNLQSGNTGQPVASQPFPGQQLPQQFGVQNQPNFPGSNLPGNVQGFGAAPVGVPGAGVTPGAPPSNQAVNLINQLLTTPRQPPTTLGQNQPPTGGGLAGVASTYKGVSIKSYGDRTKYQEWEFVFQVSQQGTLQPAAQGAGANASGLLGGPAGGGPLGAPAAPGAPGSTAPGGTTPANTTPGSATPGNATFGNAGTGFGTN